MRAHDTDGSVLEAHPGSVAGAAMETVELEAHPLTARPARFACVPTEEPHVPGAATLGAGPDGTLGSHCHAGKLFELGARARALVWPSSRFVSASGAQHERAEALGHRLLEHYARVDRSQTTVPMR